MSAEKIGFPGQIHREAQEEFEMSERYISPPDRQAYFDLVWEIVRQIPAGKVSTYGQIASMIPPPGETNPKSYLSFGARWVGGAMAACPQEVPWQRVINSQGKISLRPGGGQQVQQQLLEAEGIEFDERQRVDLRRFGWNGPAAEWLQSHNLLPPASLSKPYQTEMPL